MKIRTVDSPRESDLNNSYDLVVCCSGYESRSRFFAEKNQTIISKHRVVFSFFEHPNSCDRERNDFIYNSLGYEKITISSSDSMTCYLRALELLEKVARNNHSESRILIDISCMTTSWVSGIIKALFDFRNNKSKFKVDFHYVPAEYTAITDIPELEIVGPMQGFSGLRLPEFPTILILGLGQIPGQAGGIREYIDPERTILFAPIPGINEEYDRDILESNKIIMSKIPDYDIYHYNLLNSLNSFKQIESVVLGLKGSSAIVISSLGPKIFNLYCLIIACCYPEIGVWRATAGTREKPKNRMASEPSIYLQCEFS